MVTGKPALSDDRLVLVIGADAVADIFEVVETAEPGDPIIVARSPFLFEIGEELQVRIGEREATVRVRAHRADGATELEITSS